MQMMPLPDSFAETDEQDRSRSLAVVIAYDDMAAGRRAVRLCSHLGSEQEEDLAFQTQPWRFDLLAKAEWAVLAATAALKADLLIISSSRQSDLPQGVRDWLKACLTGKRGTEAAVVALFGIEGHAENAASPGLQFVQSAAKEAGLDFFAPSSAPQVGLANDRPRAEQLVDLTGILEEVRYPGAPQQSEISLRASPQAFSQFTGYRHWGINE
jgi:hypothetical protein